MPRVTALRTSALALGAVTGLVGCGTTTVTATQTVIRVRTVPKVVRAPAATVTVIHTVTDASAGASTAAAKGSAVGYSSAFGAKFTALCVAKLGDTSACGCALRYIEANVPYREVKAAEGDLSSGARPSWYYGALAACI